MTFYKVRQIGTDLYYSPPSQAFEGGVDKKGKRYGEFNKNGKRYVSLTEARSMVTSLNVPCEMVHYIEDVLEIGVVQPNGKTKVALNQQ